MLSGHNASRGTLKPVAKSHCLRLNFLAVARRRCTCQSTTGSLGGGLWLASWYTNGQHGQLDAVQTTIGSSTLLRTIPYQPKVLPDPLSTVHEHHTLLYHLLNHGKCLS
jgi:hypothetical protein